MCADRQLRLRVGRKLRRSGHASPVAVLHQGSKKQVPRELNQLIERLPDKPQRSLLAACEPVLLTIESVLCEAGDETTYVYFPNDGFVSLISEVDANSCLEVGMVGREGMLGVHLALGIAASPLRALVQGSGTALRVEGGDLRREIARHVALRRTVDRYLYVLMAQFALSAACLRFHLIDERLARRFEVIPRHARVPGLHARRAPRRRHVGRRRSAATRARLLPSRQARDPRSRRLGIGGLQLLRERIAGLSPPAVLTTYNAANVETRVSLVTRVVLAR
jgi:hypothetical protein